MVGGCESDLNVPKQTINAVGMELANSFYFIAPRSFTTTTIATAIKAIYSLLRDSIMGLGHVIATKLLGYPHVMLLHNTISSVKLLAQFYSLEPDYVSICTCTKLVIKQGPITLVISHYCTSKDLQQ